MTPKDLEVKLALIIDNQKDDSHKLDRLCKILEGNGSPEKGLVLRFDRIEQWWLDAKKRRVKVTLAVIGASVSFAGSLAILVIKLFWN